MKTKLKYISIGVFICFILGAGFGKTICDYLQVYQYQDMFAISAPSVSATGSARIYVDSISNTPLVSANGNPYVPLLAQPKYNYIMNGDGAIFQRSTSTVTGQGLLSCSTDVYAQDRWKVCHNMGSGNLKCATSYQKYARISSKSLTTNVASLTIDGPQCLQTQTITVACNPSDAVFDGTQTSNISSSGLPSTTITYAKTNTNVGATNTGGVVTEKGLLANSYMTFTNFSGGLGKFFLIQVIDNAQAQNLRGKTVTVQFKIKGSVGNGGADTCLIQWGSSATARSVEDSQWANPLISSFASSNPTFTSTGSNNYLQITPASVLANTSGTIVGSKLQINGAPDWSQVGYTTVVPNDFQQLALAIWCDGGITNQDFIGITEVGLYDAIELQPYNPRSLPTELAMCQRYCYVWPQYNDVQALTWTGVRGSSNQMWGQYIPYPVTLRTNPTVNFNGAGYQNSAPTNGNTVACYDYANARYYTATGAVTFNTGTTVQNRFGFQIYITAATSFDGTAFGQGILFQSGSAFQTVFNADF